MPDTDPLNTASAGVNLVAEVIKAAGDNPQAKEAANNLGQTAVTLTKTINNVLVPLAAINFAFDKARTYFSGKFQQEIAEKVQNIPPENVVEPKASVAGPALQGLAFTHEEPNLKEMYLNLLATAMDGRSSAVAHPAFVEIIRQLDSDEASLVGGALQFNGPIAVVSLRRVNEDGSFVELRAHLLNLRDSNTQSPIENPNLPSMVDNWIRLGLVTVAYDQWLTDNTAYEWVAQRPEFLKLSQAPQPQGAKIDYQKGAMRRTELGRRFASAIGLKVSHGDL